MKTKIAIPGIGNRLKCDDGAGSILAENLSLRGMTAFDCSIVPENFTGALRKAAPDILIIAALFLFQSVRVFDCFLLSCINTTLNLFYIFTRWQAFRTYPSIQKSCANCFVVSNVLV